MTATKPHPWRLVLFVAVLAAFFFGPLLASPDTPDYTPQRPATPPPTTVWNINDF